MRNIEVEGRTEERSTAMRNGVRKTEVRRSERHVKKSCASRYDRSFNGWKSKSRNACLEFGKDNRLAAMAEKLPHCKAVSYKHKN